jgi:hypothetical protein
MENDLKLVAVEQRQICDGYLLLLLSASPVILNAISSHREFYYEN